MPGEYITRLMRWDTGVEISAENYQRLRADPRYARAVRTFAGNMLAAGDADRLLDGILKDAGRNVAALCAVHLHFTGGLTLPRLKTLCASFGLISPGRARALLSICAIWVSSNVRPRTRRACPRFMCRRRAFSTPGAITSARS